MHGPEPLPRPDQVSHGICLRCMGDTCLFAVDDLFELSRGQADALPYGRLELDLGGRVTAYNRMEAELSGRDPEEVLGRNFFVEVAPCTSVRAFRGRFEELVAADRPARERFQFIFRFSHGAKLVDVAMLHDPDRASAIVLVDELVDEVLDS